jgi:uncharacterized protein YcbK (DUF882 family)
VAVFARANQLVLSCAVAVATAAAAFGGDGATSRTLSFYHIHTKETLSVVYKRNGQYVPDALKQIDWLMRDWRLNKSVKMDPETLDIIWEMHTELGSREAIHVICGHRSSGTNEMLRKSRGGQAKGSQHISGRAIDIHFPDIPARLLRYSAMIRERGGVGYYPTSALPFVHVDTARVRHWPSMGRNEMALLFPSGHSKHRPSDGGSLSPSDVKAARAKGGEAMTQVAAFYEMRNTPDKRTVMVADASGTLPKLVSPPKPVDRPRQSPLNGTQVALGTPPAAEPPSGQPNASGLVWKASPRPPEPKLLKEPRVVERPSKFATTPSANDMAGLEALIARTAEPAAAPAANPQLASLTPAEQMPDGQSWISSPEFDEDHPEELSYRPFPLAPLLTQTASADDEALGTLTHPVFSETMDLLTSDMTAPPMRLRPGHQLAELLWSKEFSGQAVDLTDLIPAESQPTLGGITERRVKTSER